MAEYYLLPGATDISVNSNYTTTRGGATAHSTDPIAGDSLFIENVTWTITSGYGYLDDVAFANIEISVEPTGRFANNNTLFVDCSNGATGTLTITNKSNQQFGIAVVGTMDILRVLAGEVVIDGATVTSLRAGSGATVRSLEGVTITTADIVDATFHADPDDATSMVTVNVRGPNGLAILNDRVLTGDLNIDDGATAVAQGKLMVLEDVYVGDRSTLGWQSGSSIQGVLHLFPGSVASASGNPYASVVANIYAWPNSKSFDSGSNVQIGNLETRP